jgi:hypothetical protein
METVAGDYDGEDTFGPTNWDFEDWWGAGEAYARENFPDWHPEMVREFSSDIAWQCEGWILTPSKMKDAAEDWFSGANPYSPHCVPLDGYDYTEWHQRGKRDSIVELMQFGVTQGMEVRQAERFAIDTMSNYSFISKDQYEKALEDWWSGANKQSPHHVPLDVVNREERHERREFLRNKYSGVSDFTFRMFFNRNLNDSATIESYLMSKIKKSDK